jgi:hypothetical protein
VQVLLAMQNNTVLVINHHQDMMILMMMPYRKSARALHVVPRYHDHDH